MQDACRIVVSFIVGLVLAMWIGHVCAGNGCVVVPTSRAMFDGKTFESSDGCHTVKAKAVPCVVDTTKI